MWGNIGNVVGAALQKVQKLQHELEAQMDAAVETGGVLEIKPAADTITTKIDDDAKLNVAKDLTVSSNPDEVPPSSNNLDVLERAKKVDTITERKKRRPRVKKLVEHDISLDIDVDLAALSPIPDSLDPDAASLSPIPDSLDIRMAVEAAISREREKYSVEKKRMSLEWSKEKESLLIKSADAEKKLRSEHDAQISDYNRKLKSSESYLSRVRKENEDYLNRIASLEAELERVKLILNEPLPSAANSAEIPKESIGNWNTSSSSDQLERITSQLRSQTEMFHKQRDRLKDAQTKNSELEESLRVYKEQLENVTHNNKNVEDIENELVKLREVVSERERALETAAAKYAETYKLLEHSTQRISDLSDEIADKDQRLRSVQSGAAAEVELRKQLSALQEGVKMKDERLAAFEAEGQILAKKQGEMEKAVRSSKKDIRERDADIAKLKESKEQLTKSIEEMQETIRKNETDVSNTTRNLSAMQAVSQASRDKLSRLEAELLAKSDELLSQRRALENAWSEASELKRSITELKADRDDLRRQIGEGTTKVIETETSRRDMETREAVLRATNIQLQASLQRQMEEAASREERLREEANIMRHRWQEAISSKESMASDMTTMTAPLLRQISSLQETLRNKSEGWQTVEGTLSERTLRAENALDMADHKRQLVEEALSGLKTQFTQTAAQLAETQSALRAAESLADKLSRADEAWSERYTELESRFSLETVQKQSLQLSLRDIEARHKAELNELRDAADAAVARADARCIQLKTDNDTLREQLQAAEKAHRGGGAVLGTQQQGGGPAEWLHSGHEGDESDVRNLRMEPTPRTNTSAFVSGILPNGDASFAGLERFQLQMRRKDGEIASLAQQTIQLQSARDALLEEVNYLSSKNGELEDLIKASGIGFDDRNAIASYRRKTDLLLILLGEKEEELEAMYTDMNEVRGMYKSQIQFLLDQLTPVSEASSLARGSSTSVNEIRILDQ